MKTVITAQEFNTDQEKYFDLAVNDHVIIKRGRIRYCLAQEVTKRKYKTPDDDLQRAITMDEFLIGAQEDLRKIFEKGWQPVESSGTSYSLKQELNSRFKQI
jgi:hypothetical protein